MSTMTIIRGLPGSGKSTLAELIANTLGEYSYHFEADEYFFVEGKYQFDVNKLSAAHQWCQDNTRKMIELGQDVVVSNTFTTLKELKPYFDICIEFKITPHIITCYGEYGSIHDVPDETMKRMKDRFQHNITFADYVRRL